MSDFPDFKSQQHYEDFVGIFKERTQNHIIFMSIVRDELYKGFTHRWENIDGRTISAIDNMTRSLYYNTGCDFKKVHPEYALEEDELFIPYRSFKETLTEVLNEALDKRNDSEGFLGGK
jgi:hypothetical protein